MSRARTVHGMVVPWYVPRHDLPGQVIYRPTDIRVPPGRLPLVRMVGKTLTAVIVGDVTDVESRRDGLWITATMARTPQGTAALQDMQEGYLSLLEPLLRFDPGAPRSRGNPLGQRANRPSATLMGVLSMSIGNSWHDAELHRAGPITLVLPDAPPMPRVPALVGNAAHR